MKLLRTFAAILFLLLPAVSTLHADNVDRFVTQGVEYLYSVRFDDAARSFDQAIAADRSDPRGYFYRANVHLWSYIFDKRPAQLDLFFQTSDQAINAAEKRIEANPSDGRSKLFLGMCYGYRAIANARAENIMAAALSARSCYDKLNDLVKDNPKYYDAYLGLGIFHFVIGSVPKAAQFMAGLSGLKGDAKLGVREIEAVAAQGNYFRNDAQMIVALLNIYYQNDFPKGIGALESISRRYPQNVAFLYALGTAYLNQNQPDRAIEYFQRVISQSNNDFKVFTDLSYGRTGIAFCQKNEFEKAKPYLQKYIKVSGETTYKAYAWYLLGLSFEIGGSRGNAVKAYEYATKSPGNTSPEDQASRRKAKLLLEKPLDPAGVAIIKALNAVAGGNYDEALRLSNGAAALPNLSPAQRAQLNYAYGRGMQGKGEYKRAVSAYKVALSTFQKEETWVAPFSCFHMAECFLKLGDKEQWRSNIELAKGYHTYDNEMLLRFLIERDVTLID
ncbi:MAG: tetratricopeptide repeat protein [Candidatus Kapaibacterium sp.]